MKRLLVFLPLLLLACAAALLTLATSGVRIRRLP